MSDLKSNQIRGPVPEHQELMWKFILKILFFYDQFLSPKSVLDFSRETEPVGDM